MPRTILDLCCGTGAWSRPYKDAGYDVIEVDVLRGQDVCLFEKPRVRIRGILCAPPCTEFACVGRRWWKSKESGLLREALAVASACVRLCVACRVQWWVIENPVGRLSRYLGQPVMVFQPWEFGDPWTKRTCLWGRFNEPVRTPVEPVYGSVQQMSKGRLAEMYGVCGDGLTRGQVRSVTPGGFARAFFEANP